MKKIYIIKTICLVVILTASNFKLNAANTKDASTKSSPNVLLISIDGLKPQYILNAEKYKLNIPSIKKVLKNGTYAPNGMTGVMPTMTFPSHTAMLTGTNPAANGIENNIKFSPKNISIWNFFASEQVENLWTAASNSGYITANIGIPVSTGAKLDFNIPTYWYMLNEIDLKYINHLSEPKNIINSLAKKIGPYTIKLSKDNYIAADIWKCNAAIYLLKNNIKQLIAKTHKPLFISMYFLDLDHVQHVNGLYTEQTKKSIEAIDKMIGQLITAFTETVGYNHIINIVSDHGFVNIDKRININSALKDAGYIKLDQNGNIRNWKVLGWYAGGMCEIILKNPQDKKLYKSVYKLLSKLAENPKNGIDKVYTKDELIKNKTFTSGSLALSAKPGYKFSKQITKQLITDSVDKGAHGHSPENKELKASYFIMGTGIPASQKIYNVNLIDVAPTLAKLMHIKLKNAEGHALDLTK